MNLKEAISKVEHELSASDKRLVDVMINSPAESALLNAAKLGERAEVHAATVVRLARKLGYSGFPELQRELQSNLLTSADPALRLEKSLERIKSGNVIAELAAMEQLNLAAIADQVSQSKIEDTAKALVTARNIYVFARGNASALAEIAIRRFHRYGLLVTDLRHQGRELAERTLSISDRDVLLCFSFRRIVPGLPTLLQHAHKVGAQTILLTDLNTFDSEHRPKVVLSASRGQSNEYQTLSVPMLMLNAVVLEMAKLPAVQTSIQKLGKLIDSFESV